ncbi:MAG: glycosyltransferase [Planctomycetes bacterium]|nr:glycosyltransferase [Planctomycetota bacterium]
MKFSIVIPSYNQAAYLRACLESVVAQEGPALEVLVYDGGSKDGSRSIVEEFASRLGYWQSQPDGGQAAALRAGFARATGDVLGWVNSDDLLLPGALAAAGEYFERHPDSPMVYGDAVWIDAAGKVIRPKREIPFDWNIFAFGYCYIPQPSCFFRRAAFEAAGGLDPTLVCCMDYDLFHRLARRGPVGHIEAFMSALRDHPATKTNTLGQHWDREHALLARRYLACGPIAYRARHLWHRMRRVAARLARGCYRPLTEQERRQCRLP